MKLITKLLIASSLAATLCSAESHLPLRPAHLYSRAERGKTPPPKLTGIDWSKKELDKGVEKYFNVIRDNGVLTVDVDPKTKASTICWSSQDGTHPRIDITYDPVRALDPTKPYGHSVTVLSIKGGLRNVCRQFAYRRAPKFIDNVLSGKSSVDSTILYILPVGTEGKTSKELLTPDKSHPIGELNKVSPDDKEHRHWGPLTLEEANKVLNKPVVHPGPK